MSAPSKVQSIQLVTCLPNRQEVQKEVFLKNRMTELATFGSVRGINSERKLKMSTRQKLCIILMFAFLPGILFAQYDSLNVKFIGSWPFGACFSVSFDPSRNLVFLGSGAGVYIYNASNPSNPVKVSEKIHTRGLVKSVFYDLSMQRLYTASGRGSLPPGCLEIWDIHAPSSPSKLGNYWTPGSGNAVYVSSSYVYIADGNSGLRIIDVSEPSNPFEVAFINTLGNTYDVFISGTYAYVANLDGVHIIDVSDPYNPQFVANCPTRYAAWDIDLSYPYAYIADGDSGLCVIDVSNPSNPQIVGFYGTPAYAWGIFADDTFAYVADGYAGLQIYKYDTSSVNIKENNGLDRVVSSSQIIFMPSIFTDKIRINFSREMDNPIEISLYNAYGACVLKKSFHRVPVSLLIEDSRIKYIPSGVYFLLIKSCKKELGKTKLIKIEE